MMRKRPSCLICSSELPEPLIDLGDQPNGNDFPYPASVNSEIYYSLKMVVCKNCYLCQLEEIPDKEVIFRSHVYVSGLNKPVTQHFDWLASHLCTKLSLKKNDLIIDIGANDGSLLKAFKKEGMLTLGVDPGSITGKLARDNGELVFGTFWGRQAGEALRSLEVKPKLITATAVFYHVPDLHDFVSGLAKVLDDEGVFVTQCVYMKSVVDNLQYDHFYHEHSCIHLLNPLMSLFEKHGLQIWDVEFNDIHGGSFIAYASKMTAQRHQTTALKTALMQEIEDGMLDYATYNNFAGRIQNNRDEIRLLLTTLKSQNRTVAGLGAPVKASTVLNYCNLGPDLISTIYEVNPLKIGRVTPGTHIPISDENTFEMSADYLILFSWNFLEYFKKKYESYIASGGKIIVFNPEVRVISNQGERSAAEELALLQQD